MLLVRSLKKNKGRGMDYKDIAEQAYKNGYKQGVNDMANKFVAQLLELFPSGKTYATISLLNIHTILTNATESKETE